MKSLILACCLLIPVAASAGTDGYAAITFGKDVPIKADTYPLTDDGGWPFTDSRFDKMHILVPKSGSYVATINIDGKPVCKVHVTKASKPEADCRFKLVCSTVAELVISDIHGKPGRTGLAFPYTRQGAKCDEERV